MKNRFCKFQFLLLLNISLFGLRASTACPSQFSLNSKPAQTGEGSLMRPPNDAVETENKVEEEPANRQESSTPSEKRDPDKVKAIEAARETASKLKQVYEETKQLAKVGSVSPPEMRRANFAYKMALLDVIELEEPDVADKINLARAKLELELTRKELAVVAALYRRGSASELEFQLATSAHEIAELGLKAVADGEGEKLYRIKIAQKQLELAKEIKQKAERLSKTGSIGQSVYQDVQQALRDAENELVAAKQNLGVQVRQVPAPGGDN